MWLSKECEKKYPHLSTSARQKLKRFPSSCLVECGFSFGMELLRAKQWRTEKFFMGGVSFSGIANSM